MRPITAALRRAVDEAVRQPFGRCEAIEDMLMIEPPPFFSMPGRNARVTRYIDFTLSAKLKSQSFGVAVEDRAVMHDAGAVEQHVDRRRPRPPCLSIAASSVTSSTRVRIPSLPSSSASAFGVHVGRPDLRALARERERAPRPDALPGRGDERDLACEPACQACGPLKGNGAIIRRECLLYRSLGLCVEKMQALGIEREADVLVRLDAHARDRRAPPSARRRRGN